MVVVHSTVKIANAEIIANLSVNAYNDCYSLLLSFPPPLLPPIPAFIQSRVLTAGFNPKESHPCNCHKGSVVMKTLEELCTPKPLTMTP